MKVFEEKHSDNASDFFIGITIAKLGKNLYFFSFSLQYIKTLKCQ